VILNVEKKVLKRVMMVVALLWSSQVPLLAQAGNYDLGSLLVTSSGPLSATTFSQVAGPTFADSFSFSLNARAATYDSAANSFNFISFNGIFGITDINTQLYNASKVAIGNEASFSHTVPGSPWVLIGSSMGLTNLAAGSYTLMVNGTSSGAGGYQTSINVTPVPEPGTYAMMLAGLGLMGFIARRRKQSKAADAF
jgi:hypothetical protein